MAQSQFGLICKAILEEFIETSASQFPYGCLWQSQTRLAKAASECIPESVLKVDPNDSRTFIVNAEEFSLSQPKWIYLRDLQRKGRTKLATWQAGTGGLNQNTHKEIVACLRQWIEWDCLPRDELLILASRDIHDRYELTKKQIRDWSKDPRKPFLNKIEGRNKYHVNASHPELRSIEKNK